jgi:putative mycofactocin binding protein MftB
MKPDSYYCLAKGVAVRSERFGGLAYRYDNRRLFFLHSHALVDFVNGLDGRRPLAEALDHFLTRRGLSEGHRTTFLKAMAQLEKLKIVAICDAPSS